MAEPGVLLLFTCKAHLPPPRGREHAHSLSIPAHLSQQPAAAQ